MSLDRALPARLMIMSAQDARGPYEHEKTHHGVALPQRKTQFTRRSFPANRDREDCV